MYIIKQYNEVLGIYPKYCKDKTKGYTYIYIENIDDLILFIKCYIKDNYIDGTLIEDSVYWNKEKKTVYFEYVLKYEDNFESIESRTLDIMEIENINTVLDITKL